MFTTSTTSLVRRKTIENISPTTNTMAATTSTPYELLGAKPLDNDLQLRIAYQKRIHEFKQDRLKASKNRTISTEMFQLICRAYETL